MIRKIYCAALAAAGMLLITPAVAQSQEAETKCDKKKQIQVEIRVQKTGDGKTATLCVPKLILNDQSKGVVTTASEQGLFSIEVCPRILTGELGCELSFGDAASADAACTAEGCDESKKSSCSTKMQMIRFASPRKLTCEQCPGSETTGKSACNKEISVQVGVPILSNLPYLSRVFKNVGCAPCDGGQCETKATELTVADCASATCADSTCTAETKTCSSFETAETNTRLLTAAACAGCDDKQTCPCPLSDGANDSCCPAAAQSCDACPMTSDVRTVGFNYYSADDGRSQVLTEEIMELRIENARLHTHLETAHDRIGILEEMWSVKEENAALRAKLEMLEQHANHAKHATSHVRIYQPAPHPVTMPNPVHPPSHQKVRLPAAPHQPNPPQPRQTQAHPKPQFVPAGYAAPPNFSQPPAGEIEKLHERIRQLQQQLNEVRKKHAACQQAR